MLIPSSCKKQRPKGAASNAFPRGPFYSEPVTNPEKRRSIGLQRGPLTAALAVLLIIILVLALVL